MRLKVVHNPDPFVHPKVIRIPKSVADSLGLRDRDVVEVKIGDRVSAAVIRSSRWILDGSYRYLMVSLILYSLVTAFISIASSRR